MTNAIKYTLEKITRLLDGELKGDPHTEICGIAPFERAGPDHLTFADKGSYLNRLDQCKAGCILIPLNACPTTDHHFIAVTNPKVAFSKAMRLFWEDSHPWQSVSQKAWIGKNFNSGLNIGIAPFAFVGDNVAIGDRTVIYPNVYIGNDVKIGEDTVIYPNVTIHRGCRIGKRVILHSETVIGSEGFGFAPDGERHVHIPQVGIVQIDDDVEIGPSNSVDRATFDKTWIKSGVKTGSHVHIAHNCTIGQNSIIIAQVGIAGSVTVGKQCIIAGKSAIAQHLSVGDNVIIGPRASVVKSIKSGEVVSGTPSMPHTRHLKVLNVFSKLPELNKKIRNLEQRIQELENQNLQSNSTETKR
jgi:UDP-3-O-[3-hydroxymyristoyl] glucosamine N-acyltransferase